MTEWGWICPLCGVVIPAHIVEHCCAQVPLVHRHDAREVLMLMTLTEVADARQADKDKKAGIAL